MRLRPLRSALSLVPDRKPQVRLSRPVMALGRSHKCTLNVFMSPYRIGLRCGDLVSRPAVRAAISQLAQPITQLLNPSRNLFTPPTQLGHSRCGIMKSARK
jgi:hypothetical protein